MAVALPAAGAGTPTLEGRENSFRQENRTSRFQLKCFWHLRYLWEKPYPGTTSPILTHTLCGLVLGGQVLLHKSFCTCSEVHLWPWQTEQQAPSGTHHSITPSKEGALSLTLCGVDCLHFPRFSRTPPLLAKALLMRDFQCSDHRNLAVGRGPRLAPHIPRTQ